MCSAGSDDEGVMVFTPFFAYFKILSVNLSNNHSFPQNLCQSPYKPRFKEEYFSLFHVYHNTEYKPYFNSDYIIIVCYYLYAYTFHITYTENDTEQLILLLKMLKNEHCIPCMRTVFFQHWKFAYHFCFILGAKTSFFKSTTIVRCI